MFSLIITIISVALVAALALATLYYGGDAFKQGKAEAEASQVLIQGQQVLAAAELYHLKHSKWPDTLQQLVEDQFLDAIPTAQAPVGALGEAVAAGRAWDVATAGVPVYVLPDVDTELCKMVNKKAFGKAGVPKKAYTALSAQCFGETPNEFTVVVTKNGTSLVDALPPDDLIIHPEPPPDDDRDKWIYPPDEPGDPGDPPVEPPPASTANFSLTLVYDTGEQLTYMDAGYTYSFFSGSAEAARVGAQTLTRVGNTYSLNMVDNGSPYSFNEALVRVDNAGAEASVLQFSDGRRFYGKQRFGTASMDGVSFCEAGQTVPAGGSCLVSMKLPDSCSAEYQGLLGNLTVYAKSLDNSNGYCTDVPPEDEPDVIQPGLCPFTYNGPILVNNTSNTYTITAATGYHFYGTLINKALSTPHGWSGYGTLFDLPYKEEGYSLSEMETIWQTTTRSVNETIEPGLGVAAYNNAGAVMLGITKGAVYVQELDTWCAWGEKSTNSSADAGTPGNGQKFYIGIQGSAWNPPPEMDGAWVYKGY